MVELHQNQTVHTDNKVIKGLRRSPLWWFVPLLFVIVGFYLYPTLEVVRFSLTDATLLSRDYDYTWTTYRNVLRDPNLPIVLRATAVFVGGSVVVQIILGLAIALVVNRGKNRHLIGTVFVRTIILSAWIIPGIAAGIVWEVILNEAGYGLITAAFRSLSRRAPPLLSTPTAALVSVTVANVWRGTAFSMILLYAGLQGIAKELYEAAEVDGANGTQAFWHITLPQLRTVLLINIILITIATFNSFDLILPLTGGGPGRATEVLSLYTYNAVFRNYDLASGSALAVLMLLITLLITWIYTNFLPKEEQQ